MMPEGKFRSWAASRAATAQTMWLAGFSYTEIATHLTSDEHKLTPNAIKGLLYRTRTYRTTPSRVKRKPRPYPTELKCRRRRFEGKYA